MDYLMKSDRLYLRKMTVEDTDNILRWRNNPEVVKNFIYRIPVTREDHLNWIKTKVETGLVCQFVVGRIEDGREFGSIYFRDIDRDNLTCEFGIFLGEEDMAGKGYGYEGQKMAMNYAFTVLGMKLVKLRVLEKNAAAIRNYEKCGFKLLDKVDYVGEGPDREKILFMECEKYTDL